ncbi:MAG TPA: rod shape-determining protein MreC [Anaerolineales bacterium]|nr:rod shape-determining protein MreC [Anaerolineales bacterium]
MKASFPRSLQTVVIVLVSIGLVVLALGGYFNPVTNWASRLTVDVQTWVSSRYMALVDFLTVPRDVATLRQRNSELEAEVARLQTQVVELQQQVTETNILSALVDFARANPEYSYKAAAVIGRDPSPFLRYVIINIGSNEGVLPGMPVVTDKGLVGRVDAVIAEAARVELITDSASAVNVRMQASDTEALLIGSITGDLSLDMIPQDATVTVGDVVLTSGLGGTYPPNLLVGQVVSVRKLNYELFQQASIQPNVDFNQLQFILVITNFNPVNITPLIATPGP